MTTLSVVIIVNNNNPIYPHIEYVQKKFNIGCNSFPFEFIQWDTTDKWCNLPLGQFLLHHTQWIICNRCGFDFNVPRSGVHDTKKCLLSFRLASLCVWLVCYGALINGRLRVGLWLVWVQVRVLCYRTLKQVGTLHKPINQWKNSAPKNFH